MMMVCLSLKVGEKRISELFDPMNFPESIYLSKTFFLFLFYNISVRNWAKILNIFKVCLSVYLHYLWGDVGICSIELHRQSSSCGIK